MDSKKILQVVLTLVVVGSFALLAGSILSASDEVQIRRPTAPAVVHPSAPAGSEAKPASP